MVTIKIITEIRSFWDRLFGWTELITRRLGRHQRFDPRSRNYRVVLDDTTFLLKYRMWERKLKPLFQGDIGSCTGNAIVGLLATEPNNSDSITHSMPLNEDWAIHIYSRATEIDQFQDTYPPTDTGSSVLSAIKAAKEMGVVSEYRWCFGIEDVLRTLSHVGPVAVGINWYQGFDKPDRDGLIKISGKVRGGHAVELLGIDPEKQLVHGINSWGWFWGKWGRFSISFTDLNTLLSQKGEAVTIVK